MMYFGNLHGRQKQNGRQAYIETYRIWKERLTKKIKEDTFFQNFKMSK
jgi:hypothetical protein